MGVEDVPNQIDLAVIIVPALLVPDVIRDCVGIGLEV